MGAPMEAGWLAKMSAAAGYVVIFISELLGGQGGDAVICFCMPTRNRESAYSVIGGGLFCQWRRTLSMAAAEAKMEVGANCEDV